MHAHATNTATGLRVLVIEDQHDIAANIWDYLERRGYHVDHCADGASGLVRALRDPFDAIVLDLGLPRLDGLDSVSYTHLFCLASLYSCRIQSRIGLHSVHSLL